MEVGIVNNIVLLVITVIHAIEVAFTFSKKRKRKKNLKHKDKIRHLKGKRSKTD